MLPIVGIVAKVISKPLNKVFYLTSGPRRFLCIITRVYTPPIEYASSLPPIRLHYLASQLIY